MNKPAISINQRLALVALGLGALALFGGPRASGTVALNSREVAVMVERGVDQITVHEVADWIIQGRADFRLLDVRGTEAYGIYHIPSAENVHLTAMPDYPLYRNETIIIYSDDETRTAQAWFLLRANGYAGAYILRGGLDAWKEEILFPSLSPDAGSAEAARFQKANQVSQYFGGTPRTGGVEQSEAATFEMPEVELPTHAPVTRKKRKHKDGC